jgi:GT2 family glycosyltransferase
MTNNVSVVVLAHDEPELLAAVLVALEKQTVQPNQVLIVDTSKSKPVSNSKFEVLTLSPRTNLADSLKAAVDHLNPEGYLWILHDDSAPHETALAELLKTVEISPSIAVAGPKQLDWDNPKIIKQLGLTLTPSGRLFSRVRGEFDQGQHDNSQDVLAVGTAGALINLEAYKKLDGFDKKAPPLASDVDFCIRARLNGYRVSVAPSAKISHKMLSLSGKRPFSWLGGTPGSAIRQAELHIQLSHTNLLLFLAAWLFLIPASLISSLWLVLSKRGNLVAGELSGALATFFSLGRIFSSRRKLSKTTNGNLSALVELRASRAEVKADRQRAKDELISSQLLAAHARGESEGSAQARAKGLIDSGALWVFLGLTLLGITWFPSGVAAAGPGLIPLSGSWLEIFSRAGSENHLLGLGFSGAADPFVWTLLILSLPFAFEPTLAVTVIYYLALPLAFLGAFKLTSLVTANTGIRMIAALSYAFWPAMTISISETRFNSILTQLLLPWLLFSLARILNFGRKEPGSPLSIWVHVGLSALLLAMLSSLSPVLGGTLFIAIFLAGLSVPKRLIPLLFSTGLTVAWFLPLGAKRFREGGLLSILRDPGVALESGLQQSWSLPLFGYRFDSIELHIFLVLPLVLAALLAWFSYRLLATAGLWSLTLLAFTAAYMASGISYVAGESAIGLDVYPLLAVAGLSLSLLTAGSLDGTSKLRVVSALVILGLLPAVFSYVTTKPEVFYSSGQIVPSIIQAASDAGLEVRTLKLSLAEDGSVAVEIVNGDGVKLDEISTSYQLQSRLSGDSEELGLLVSNLASANGAEVVSSFRKFKISYVLVSPASRDLQMALDSTRGLESIGETDFGQLWKVSDVTPTTISKSADFSFAKIYQLATLAFYLALLIPAGAQRRRNGKESEIFIDAEEEN